MILLNKIISRKEFLKKSASWGISTYFSYFIGKNLINFKNIDNYEEIKSLTKIVKTSKGDNIYFRGYVFKEVQEGDIILRQIDTNWGNLGNKIVNRFIALGIPGFYEHACLYIGNGKVINIGPDDPNNVITIKNLDTLIENCPIGHFHILKMSENKAVRKKALTFIEFHKNLAQQKKVKYKKESSIKKILLTTPINYKNTTFNYYYDGLTCILGILKAYDFAGKNIEKQIMEKRTNSETIKSLLFFLYPSTNTLSKFLDRFWFTGYHLKHYAEKEIYPEKI